MARLNAMARGAGSLAIVGLLLTSVLAAPPAASAAVSSERQAIVLRAADAHVTGALRILDDAVHYWIGYGDTIGWSTQVPKAGIYRIRLAYSLSPSMTGGTYRITVGEHSEVRAALPTADWKDIRTFDAGLVRIDRPGTVPVSLRADRLPGIVGGALPDVSSISLTPATEMPASPATPRPPGVEALFDGATLHGWGGSRAWFHVKDGAVVGGSSTKALAQNEFLASERRFGDFELRAAVRLTGSRGNGGIQFRSQRVPGSSEMTGYQADASEGIWGNLYDESRRARFLGTRLNEAAARAALRPDEWNDYIIRCEGPRTRIWLNGVLTVDYTEADRTIPLTGRLGLQIHSGPPSQASYRDIVIEPLKPASRQ